MAVLPIAAYDPSRVIQNLGDLVPQAYGPDSRISITKTVPPFSVMQGQDGHIIRVKTRAFHHLVQFVLMKSDPVCDAIDELIQKDTDDLTPSGIFKYELTDNNGKAKATAPYAWFTGKPDVIYTAAGEAYTYDLVLASAIVTAGSMTLLP